MRFFLVLLLLAVLGGGGWWWYQKTYAVPDQPRVLATKRLESGNVSELLEATGIIKPQVGAEIQIGAQATGRIVEMLVRVGDSVREGDVIARIDDRELRSEHSRVEAEILRARATLVHAERTLQRQSALLGKSAVSKDAVDDAQVAVDQARATLLALEAQLRTLEVRLSHTRVISPISGVVSQVTADEGETIVTGLSVANLVTVLDPTRLELWVYMDETDIGQVRVGQAVEFHVDAYPDKTFHSSVRAIYPKPEIRDNIVYYLAVVPLTPEQAADLRPEMTAQCRLVVREKQDVLALPNSALKWVDGRLVVFVVSETPGGADKAQTPPLKMVEPELGLRGLTHSEVLAGLEADEVVATQIVLPQEAAAQRTRSAAGPPGGGPPGGGPGGGRR